MNHERIKSVNVGTALPAFFEGFLVVVNLVKPLAVAAKQGGHCINFVWNLYRAFQYSFL
jgi:hypothetical protein